MQRAVFGMLTGKFCLIAGKVEDSIRMGGLAEIKTERIKAILSMLKEERGEISLEYVRDMEDEDIKNELTRWDTGHL